MRRLDMLRMRFLVAYMGLVSAGRVKKLSSKTSEKTGPLPPPPPPLPPLPLGMSSGVKKKSTRRRQSRAAALGRGDNTDGGRKAQGWAGVIRELQLSPLLQKRHAHASIGKAMSPIKSHFMVPEPPPPPESAKADRGPYEHQTERFPEWKEPYSTF